MAVVASPFEWATASADAPFDDASEAAGLRRGPMAPAVGPWVLGGGGLAAQLTGLATGVAVIALTLPRGHIRERFRALDRLVPGIGLCYPASFPSGA